MKLTLFILISVLSTQIFAQKQNTCGITDFILAEQALQKAITEFEQNGVISEATLGDVLNVIVKIADDCLHADIQKPTQACDDAAYAVEQAIIKLRGDIAGHKGQFTIIADIIEVWTKVGAFRGQCVVQGFAQKTVVV